MPVLAVIAFFIWQRYLVLFWELRRALTGAEMFEEVEFTPAHSPALMLPPEFEKGSAGAVPAILLAIKQSVGGVPRPIVAVIREARERQLAQYNQAFYVLAALVAAAPLVGLLGTVLGMIQTFDAVGMRSSRTAVLVARGISQALITTQVGLLAALPGTFGLAHLHRLYRRLVNAVDRCESHLVLKIAGKSGLGGRSAPPLEGGTTPACRKVEG